MRLRPTGLGVRAGLFYAAVLVASQAAAYANLMFLLVAFLGVLAALGVWWTRRNLVGMDGEILGIEPAPADAGQRFDARIEVAGRPRFRIDAVLEIDGHDALRAGAQMVHGETRLRGEIPPLPRGLYDVKAAWLETTYPLGVMRARRRIAAPTQIVVYPTPADLPQARSGSEIVAGLSGQIAGGAGTSQPDGLREYRDGDDPRSVHWRASARRNTLVVREWSGEGGSGLELLLDRRTDPESLEDALCVVTAVALAARDNKERLTIHSQRQSVTYGPGHASWDELLTFLAGAQVLPPDGPAPPPVSPSVLRLPLRERRRVPVQA